MISLQQEMATGITMLILFAAGHCLPLILCGVFSARTMSLLHSHAGHTVVAVPRKLAAVVIAGLGVYFASMPWRG
jgi:cytochrome c-type biogenesis protein